MKILAIIPARGGSKGVKNKNIVNLHSKPLIAYTVNEALKSKNIDKIFLSSDSDDIINVVKELGVYSAYKRPTLLSSDTATSQDVVMDALHWLEKNQNYIPDAILLLQPTSPLRLVEDIDISINMFIKSNKKCLVSVNEMGEHPYECVKNIDKDNWQYLASQKTLATRRQDYKESFYYINGALYLSNTEFFKKNKVFIENGNTKFYVMPLSRSIDIDTMDDLDRADFLLQNLKHMTTPL